MNNNEKVTGVQTPKSPEKDGFLEIMLRSNSTTQNLANNNITLSPLKCSSPKNDTNNQISFGGMSNEQIQHYLVNKFKTMDIQSPETDKQSPNNNTHEVNHNETVKIKLNFSNYNLPDNPFNSEEFNEYAPVNLSNSMLSLNSTNTSSDSSSNSDSSDEDVAFIKPLSHNATLTATGEDGKVRLIVPVSPTSSTTNMVPKETSTQKKSSQTLKVPGAENTVPTSQGAITRTTSEKVPNRSEMMTALRAQWTRHTTK